MGQKTYPIGNRLGIIRTWDSRWFAKKADFADNLIEDINLRKAIKERLYHAGVTRIEMERFGQHRMLRPEWNYSS